MVHHSHPRRIIRHFEDGSVGLVNVSALGRKKNMDCACACSSYACSCDFTLKDVAPCLVGAEIPDITIVHEAGEHNLKDDKSSLAALARYVYC